MAEKKQSIGAKLAEDFLNGVVESVARAGAKAVESLASDAVKSVGREKRKIENFRNNIREWRKVRLGEIDSDVPQELRDE